MKKSIKKNNQQKFIIYIFSTFFILFFLGLLFKNLYKKPQEIEELIEPEIFVQQETLNLSFNPNSGNFLVNQPYTLTLTMNAGTSKISAFDLKLKGTNLEVISISEPRATVGSPAFTAIIKDPPGSLSRLAYVINENNTNLPSNIAIEVTIKRTTPGVGTLAIEMTAGNYQFVGPNPTPGLQGENYVYSISASQGTYNFVVPTPTLTIIPTSTRTPTPTTPTISPTSTPPPVLPTGFVLNSATGKSCNQICSEKGKVCTGVTYVVTGTITNMASKWNINPSTGEGYCAIRDSSCSDVMINNSSHVCCNAMSCHQADWTYCSCFTPTPTPTRTPTPTPTRTPTPTPTIISAPTYPGCGTGELLSNPQLTGTTGWHFWNNGNTTGQASEGKLILQTLGSGSGGYSQFNYTNLRNKRLRLSGSLARSLLMTINPYLAINAHKDDGSVVNNYGGILSSTSPVGVFEQVSKEINIGSDVNWIEIGFAIWNAPSSTSYADWISLCVM